MYILSQIDIKTERSTALKLSPLYAILQWTKIFTSFDCVFTYFIAKLPLIPPALNVENTFKA